MEIPLTLTLGRNGTLIYGIPLWFRLTMAGIVALLIAAFSIGGTPGVLGWIVLAATLASLLYEERWTVDPKMQRIAYTSGLLPLARRLTFAFNDIDRFVLEVVARGQVPGSAGEQHVVDSVLRPDPQLDAQSGMAASARDYARKRSLVRILIEKTDGGVVLVNMAGARKAPQMAEAAKRLASACGKQLAEA